MTKRIFISADNGVVIIYFLQSDVASTLLAKSPQGDAGVEVVVLTDRVREGSGEEKTYFIW